MDPSEVPEKGESSMVDQATKNAMAAKEETGGDDVKYVDEFLKASEDAEKNTCSQNDNSSKEEIATDSSEVPEVAPESRDDVSGKNGENKEQPDEPLKENESGNEDVAFGLWPLADEDEIDDEYVPIPAQLTHSSNGRRKLRRQRIEEKHKNEQGMNVDMTPADENSDDEVEGQLKKPKAGEKESIGKGDELNFSQQDIMGHDVDLAVEDEMDNETGEPRKPFSEEFMLGVKIPKLGKANPKYVALRWSEGSFVEPKLEYDMSTKGPQRGQLKAARLQRDGFVDLAYREHLEHLIKEDLDSRGLEHELEAVVKSVVNVNYNSERGQICGEMVITFNNHRAKRIIYHSANLELVGKDNECTFQVGDAVKVKVVRCLTNACYDIGIHFYAMHVQVNGSVPKEAALKTMLEAPTEIAVMVEAKVVAIPKKKIKTKSDKIIVAQVFSGNAELKDKLVLCPAGVFHAGKYPIGGSLWSPGTISIGQPLVLKVRKIRGCSTEAELAHEATIAWIGPFYMPKPNGVLAVSFLTKDLPLLLKSGLKWEDVLDAGKDRTMIGMMTPKAKLLTERAFQLKNHPDGFRRLLVTAEDVINAAALVEILSKSIARQKNMDNVQGRHVGPVPVPDLVGTTGPPKKIRTKSKRVNSTPLLSIGMATFKALGVALTPAHSAALHKMNMLKKKFFALHRTNKEAIEKLKNRDNLSHFSGVIASIVPTSQSIVFIVAEIIQAEKEIWLATASHLVDIEKKHLLTPMAFDAIHNRHAPLQLPEKGSFSHRIIFEPISCEGLSSSQFEQITDDLLQKCGNAQHDLGRSLHTVGLSQAEVEKVRSCGTTRNKVSLSLFLLDCAKRLRDWEKRLTEWKRAGEEQGFLEQQQQQQQLAQQHVEHQNQIFLQQQPQQQIMVQQPYSQPLRPGPSQRRVIPPPQLPLQIPPSQLQFPQPHLQTPLLQLHHASQVQQVSQPVASAASQAPQPQSARPLLYNLSKKKPQPQASRQEPGSKGQNKNKRTAIEPPDAKRGRIRSRSPTSKPRHGHKRRGRSRSRSPSPRRHHDLKRSRRDDRRSRSRSRSRDHYRPSSTSKTRSRSRDRHSSFERDAVPSTSTIREPVISMAEIERRRRLKMYEAADKQLMNLDSDEPTRSIGGGGGFPPPPSIPANLSPPPPLFVNPLFSSGSYEAPPPTVSASSRASATTSGWESSQESSLKHSSTSSSGWGRQASSMEQYQTARQESRSLQQQHQQPQSDQQHEHPHQEKQKHQETSLEQYQGARQESVSRGQQQQPQHHQEQEHPQQPQQQQQQQQPEQEQEPTQHQQQQQQQQQQYLQTQQYAPQQQQHPPPQRRRF